MRRANYTVVEDTKDRIVIRDIGPWDVYPSVTNAVEQVVEELAPQLNGRKLFYFDTENQMDEIVYENNKFKGFKVL